MRPRASSKPRPTRTPTACVAPAKVELVHHRTERRGDEPGRFRRTAQTPSRGTVELSGRCRASPRSRVRFTMRVVAQAFLIAALTLPVAVHAQGIVGGAQRGAEEG